MFCKMNYKLAGRVNQSHISKLGVQRIIEITWWIIVLFGWKKIWYIKINNCRGRGFTGIINSDNYSQLTTNDFIEYGIIR